MIPAEVKASADVVCDVVAFAAVNGNLADLLPDASIHMAIALAITLRQLQLFTALQELEAV